MQLFLTDIDFIWENHIRLFETRIFHQLRNVLRAKAWYEFLVQNDWNRFLAKIIEFWDNYLDAKIIGNFESNFISKDLGMIICTPNKFEKIEIIVQKLSEIWVSKIIFWSSARSQIKSTDFSEQKISRLKKISLEAIEQSKWFILPELFFLDTKDLKKILWKNNVVVFDKWWKKNFNNSLNNVYWLIWPEWWFSQQDMEIFWDQIVEKIDLGDSILRTETAAIIWAWILKNN